MNIKANQLAIPGIIAAMLLLIFFTQTIATPSVVWAFSSNQPDLSVNKIDRQVNGISPAFPAAIQNWKEEIEKQAKQAGVDANLIAAVILQESGGDASAYSASGAVGLMQVMPQDGLAAGFFCDGQPCFQSRPRMLELYDPQFNIEFGVSMLKSLFNQYGNWRDALHSYGPMDVGYEYADRVLSILQQFS
jgi:soluble lytic murein transglycosylase-like protein